MFSCFVVGSVLLYLYFSIKKTVTIVAVGDVCMHACSVILLVFKLVVLYCNSVLYSGRCYIHLFNKVKVELWYSYYSRNEGYELDIVLQSLQKRLRKH